MELIHQGCYVIRVVLKVSPDRDRDTRERPSRIPGQFGTVLRLYFVPRDPRGLFDSDDARVMRGASVLWEAKVHLGLVTCLLNANVFSLNTLQGETF